jgi:hypothetical protein
MMDIKKFAAGVIAGAAITAAPLVAFATPATAATDASNSGAGAASHARVSSGAQDQLGNGSAFAKASHATPCGGGMNCDYCGCR